MAPMMPKAKPNDKPEALRQVKKACPVKDKMASAVAKRTASAGAKQASAVAKQSKEQRKGQVSVDARDDEPSPISEPATGKTRQVQAPDDDSSYYSESYSESDRRSPSGGDKDGAKFRGADVGRSSSSSPSPSPFRPPKRKSPRRSRSRGRGRSRDKAPRAKKKHSASGSAVVEPPRATSSKGAAVSESSCLSKKYKGSSVANNPVVEADAEEHASGEKSPKRRPAVADSETEDDRCYERAVAAQFMYDVDKKEKQIYRNRGTETEDQWKSRGRCKELNLPTSTWTVDKDADPDEIEAHLHGDEAKRPFATVIFVDKTAEERSAAFDRLCELARRQRAGETEKSENELAKRMAVFRIGKKKRTYFFLVLHRHWVVHGMYDDHKFKQYMFDAEHSLLRFGTIHLELKQDRQSAPGVCIGVVCVPRGTSDVDDILFRPHAEALAEWTSSERHDFVIVQAGKDVSPAVWKDFATASHARYMHPVYQPLLVKQPPAVAVAAHGPAVAVDRPSFWQSLIFLYGKYRALMIPPLGMLQAYEPGACVFVLS